PTKNGHSVGSFGRVAGTEGARPERRGAPVGRGATGPSANLRYGRYGIFCQGSRGSLRLELDYLGPFLGFGGNQLSELSRRSRQRHAAEVSETGLHLSFFCPRARFIKVGRGRFTRLPHDQRRYATVREYLIRLAAEQESRDAAPAV